MAPPGRSVFTRRTTPLKSTPNRFVPYVTSALLPNDRSALLKDVLNSPLVAGDAKPYSGCRETNWTVPPSESDPYWAVFGPRSSSTERRLVGSFRLKNVLIPPRWVELV